MKKIILPSLLLLLALFSCRREEIIAGKGVTLKFSTDTVFLDTVFTTVGSSTYNLKVFNPSNEAVVVDNIHLESDNGFIRLNIDGTASNNLNDVEILPQDSIYIFIEITDRSKFVPGDSSTFLYTDRILFENKGTRQNVRLITTVRDAYFHFPNKFTTVGGSVIPYSIIDCNTTWTNDKRHVVYGYAVVDSACVLNINKGAEVYFHNNSGLWVYRGGSLRVGDDAGTPGSGDSVIFSGDRLEPFYEDVAGQWGGALGGVFLQGGSLNNSFKNTVIKNATTALRLDSTVFQNLEISNSYILNSSRTGIFGGFGNMKAENLVVANAGVQLFYALGGSYEFRQCTFANYWNQSSRSTPAVALANFIEIPQESGPDLRLVRALNKAYFGNCLVVGNNIQELAILKDESQPLNYFFNHAILDVNSDPEERGFDLNDPSNFQEIRINADPGFINAELNRYALDSSSQAIDQGNPTDGASIATDIVGKPRNDNGIPDLGAFEWQKN